MAAGLDHTKLGVFQKYPFAEKRDRISRKYQLVKTFKTSILTRDDWKIPDFLTDPNLELWFTDGSNVNDHFGVEIYGSRTNHRERAFLWKSHGYLSVYEKSHRMRET